MKVLINGVGVAGPTLAWWLTRSGHEVTLVESAPALRTGGYLIDFWGVGYDVAERMSILQRILATGYQVMDVRFENQRGRKTGGFGVDVFKRATDGRFTSIRRSDLAATIYGALDGRAETLFGDSVAAVEERGAQVHVEFEHAAPRTVD